MLNITSYVSLNDEETNRKKSVGGLLYEIIEYTHKNLHDLYSLATSWVSDTHIVYCGQYSHGLHLLLLGSQ